MRISKSQWVAFTLGAFFTALVAPAFGAQLVQSSLQSTAKATLGGLEIIGKSTEGRGELTRNEKGLQSLKTKVAATSLKTGIELRDEHMVKYIFLAPGADAQAAASPPDLAIEGEFVSCAIGAKQCDLKANITIAGVTKPYTFPTQIESQGADMKIQAQPIVKLSDFGIKAPKYLGVTVKDEVELKLEGTFR